MINRSEILQTIAMIDQQHLDIRTITMGISLLDCADADIERSCTKVYDKICRLAGDLVRTGEDIEAEFGIPIVNKRVSVTPISLVGAGTGAQSYVPYAKALDRAAHEIGVNFLGGFSALVHKGMTESDRVLIASIPEALAETELVCASVNVGSTRAGINMDAVAEMGRTVKRAAALTADQGGMACAKLVVFANAVEDNPFMAGAFHGVGEPECEVHVGVSGPGVVQHALQSVHGQPFDVVAETVKKTAFRITRMGQLVAQEASARLGVPFGIVDLSLAPTPAVGDSVAAVLEEMGLESVGAPPIHPDKSCCQRKDPACGAACSASFHSSRISFAVGENLSRSAPATDTWRCCTRLPGTCAVRSPAAGIHCRGSDSVPPGGLAAQ